MESKGEWSRQQRRCYHVINTLLTYWVAHGYQVLRVDLTSSPKSDSEKLRYNHRQLRRKVEREYGFDKIEDFVVETEEGHGVLHILWAWKGDKDFYVPQDWLSAEWDKLHQAYVVWIARVDKAAVGTRKRISTYIVSQYISGQAGFVRYSFSWSRSFGFSIRRYWKKHKDYWLNYHGSDYKEMLWLWEQFCMGKRLPDNVRGSGWFKTISELRGELIA